MYYSRWSSEEELDQMLSKEHSGVPIKVNGKESYSLENAVNNLIVGGNGSGKTQVTIMPLVKSAISFNESFIIKDDNNVVDTFKDELNINGYRIINIDFDNANISNYFNPLEIPYNFYKENNEKYLELLDEVGYYLFIDNNRNADPFWLDSCINYFVGLTLYNFEKGKMPNLIDVYNLSVNLQDDEYLKDFLSNLDKKSNIYLNLVGTLTAPKETRGSIVSVFNQKIKNYIDKPSLNILMSKSDINVDVLKEKIAIFVSSNMDYSDNLACLIISQVCRVNEIFNTNKFHIIISDFDTLNPFKNFVRMLNNARKYNMLFTITINSLTQLKNVYGKENVEMILMNFDSIIYLHTIDIDTLKQISLWCGYESKDKELISIDELKTLKMFDAILIVRRVYPIRVSLHPYYKY